jgi:hypothetical protein
MASSRVVPTDPCWTLDVAGERPPRPSRNEKVERVRAAERASAIDEGIEEQTEDRIEESEKHDRGILAGWIRS